MAVFEWRLNVLANSLTGENGKKCRMMGRATRFPMVHTLPRITPSIISLGKLTLVPLIVRSPKNQLQSGVYGVPEQGPCFYNKTLWVLRVQRTGAIVLSQTFIVDSLL